MLLLSDADVFAGTERHMFDLACGLRDAGVTALIGSPSPSALQDRAQAAGIEHVCIQKGGLIDREAVRALIALLNSERIDLIHAHNGRTMLSAAIAVTRAKKGSAIATQHFLEPDHETRSGPKRLVYGAAHRWVASRLKGYIAISEAVRSAMLRRGEAKPEKIRVVLNGIPPIDKSALRSPAQVRSDLGVPESHLLIVSAARLEREKDVGTLVNAVDLLKTHTEGITCLVAGAGSLESGLRAQVSQLQLEDRVRILGFRDDIHQLISACNLFVLPSLAEPFGLVLLEAMALGRPVVATDAGGPREIVSNGETGLLCSPADAASLAKAIQHFVDKPDELTRMGALGLARFEERFTAARMTRSMIEAYEAFLRLPAARPA